MRYISVQTDEIYYAWQIEVMLDNFIENEVNPDDIDILVSLRGPIANWWVKLKEKFSKVHFYFYTDREKWRWYESSVRFNILAQHWNRFPLLQNETFYYHDCDAIFTKKLNFAPYLNDDIWYMSDTKHYIGARYIREKGEQVYLDMCNIAGIDPQIPIANENNSGGAQYILKNVTEDFWNECERVSEEFFRFYSYSQQRYESIWKQEKLDSGEGVIFNGKFIKKQHGLLNIPKVWEYHPLQIFCSDMWALLYCAWKRGIKTATPQELDFAWATDNISRWDEVSIYHNAGATEDRKDLFFKNEYKFALPYDNKLYYSDKYCSKKYIDQIRKTSYHSCLK